MTRKALKLSPALLAIACALLLALASAASAEISFDSSFGGEGSGAGKFATPAGLAVNTASNDVYVVDRGQNRVEQFSADGDFVRAWGYDVVESGPDDAPLVDEVDEVRIRASSGTFSLGYEGEATAPLAFDASPAAVEAAINALPAISAGGGSVTVAGGPGDPSGDSPYEVTFDGGPLSKTNVQLSLDANGLGIPAGTPQTCVGGSNENQFTIVHTDSLDYQWLANGVPVPGATDPTFTPGASEAGKAIQCTVTAVFGPVKTVTASRPYYIASPAAGSVPPLSLGSLAPPTGKPVVGGLGGNNLKCLAGSWAHEPTGYTYQWYRNGTPIGEPRTSAATEDEYTLTEEDLEAQSVFQCAVTATNSGGSSIVFSRLLENEPNPSTVREATADVSLPLHSRSGLFPRTNGGAAFEICEAADTCKAGVAGGGVGQLGTPRGIAVDNSPGGQHAVYVLDDENARVQKFSSVGEPVLSFGREVDQTTQEDICTVASGDTCGPGVRTAPQDLTPAGFGIWPNYFEFDELGNELAVDPAGNVYVGDAREGRRGGRIQKFDSGGHFLSQALPRIAPGPTTPISIAVDSHENSYAAVATEFGGALRTLASEFSADGDGTQYIGNLVHTDRNARHLAIDPRNDRLLVGDVNDSQRASMCGGPPTSNRAIVEYDEAQHEIDCSVPKGPAALPQITGIAASGDGHLYVSVGSAGVIKKFSLPVSTSPQVGPEKATDITTTTARLHGEVNPGFEDTTYSVEYGTEPCSAGSCQSAEGGILRGLKFVDGSVPIAGLQPDTTYYYRVAAENRIGSDIGDDRSFTTFSLVDLTNDPCANALARKQTRTAGLLDCRAYELATAGNTGGYDVVSDLVPGQEPFDAHPDAAGRLLYGVKDGGIPGTDNPTNRGIDPYVATRGENGWSTRYVGIPANNPFATAPFSSTLTGSDSALDTFAFGAADICDHCFADGSSGVPVRTPSDQLTQGMAGEFSHPEAKSDGYIAESLSANGEHLIFGSTARFAVGGNDETGDVSIYDRNLKTGATHVISNSATGGPLACLQGAGSCHSPGNPNGIAELAITPDGSRVVLAQKVGVDAKGNVLWHLYLNAGDSATTVDLTPGTTTGVYFDGITAAGDRVFFTTSDQLADEDDDESADVYEAETGAGTSADLSLISTLSDGSPSNDDSCSPAGSPNSWNSPTAGGKCSAVAFADGSGLAAGSGTFFFVTPEQLEAGAGEPDQANLYVVQPGGDPSFVATIDSSSIKPGPSPAARPLADAEFAGAQYFAMQAMTVDQANGDIYIAEPFEGKVLRFDSSGAPADFSAGPGSGTNAITGVPFELFHFSSAGLAVDNSTPSASTPLSRALYVASGNTVAIFAPSGEQVGALDGSGTDGGSFGEPCGAAVDQATGTLYVADRGKGLIYQYTPNNPSGTIEDADYTVKSISTSGTPCSLAVDGAGHLYVAGAPAELQEIGGPVRRFDTAAFATGAPPSVDGTEVTSRGSALATDPVTNELYVNEASRIAIYDSSGTELTSYAQSELATGCGFIQSRGIALNLTTHHTYLPCTPEGGELMKIKEYGYDPPPFTPIDNPGIVHAIDQSGTHDFGDFQVTADGSYAAFPSAMPIKSGYDNALQLEVYRYRGSDGALTCVSCSPTGSQAQSDSTLPSHGIGLLGDGRVFFNSGEGLTLSDTNGRQDAYEWSQPRAVPGGCRNPDGCQQLISTGNSSSPSGLLGASRDGKDVFFFTRDTLVPEDRNGKAMKIYDAREGGGYFVIPPPPPCAASDECHGPTSAAAAPSPIGTLKGSGGQAMPEAVKCRKGFVRRKGHCVKKHHKKKHHKKKHHKKHSKKRGGRR
jgi:hypothetical protein